MPQVSRSGVFIDSAGHKRKAFKLEDVLSEHEEIARRIKETEIDRDDLRINNLSKNLHIIDGIIRSSHNPFVRAKCMREHAVSDSVFNLNYAVTNTRAEDREKEQDREDNPLYQMKQAVKMRIEKTHIYRFTPKHEKEGKTIENYLRKVIVNEMKSFYDFNKARLLVALDSPLEDILSALAIDAKCSAMGTHARVENAQSLKTLLIRHKVLETHPALFEKAKRQFQNQALLEERELAERLPSEQRPTEEKIQEKARQTLSDKSEQIIQKANQFADDYARQNQITIDEFDIGKVITLEGGEDPIQITVATNQDGEITAVLHYQVDVRKITYVERFKENLREQFPDRARIH